MYMYQNNVDIALILEPLGEQGKICGLGYGIWHIICDKSEEKRKACKKNYKLTPLRNIYCRGPVAVKTEVKRKGNKKLVFESAYLPTSKVIHLLQEKFGTRFNTAIPRVESGHLT